MSDREDDHDDTDEEGLGMRAAYSVDDLMAALDGDDEDDDHNPKESLDDEDTMIASGISRKEEDGDDKDTHYEDDSTTNHEERKREDTCLSDEPSFGLATDKNRRLNEEDKPEERQRKDSTSSESVDKGQNVKDADDVSESNARLYESAEEIRVRKGQSRSTSNETESKIVFDASGCSNGDSLDYANVGQPTRSEDTSEETFYDDVAGEDENQKGGTLAPGQKSSFENAETIYENVDNTTTLENDKNLHGSNVDDDGGWASSEFEEYDDSGDQSQKQSSENINRAKTKDSVGGAAPKTNGKTKLDRLTGRMSRFTDSASNSPNMLEKVAARLSQKIKGDGNVDDAAEDESGVLDMPMNFSKHPPPEFPPAPSGLSPLQMKRRHIVCTIVESETSYSSSLQRLVEDYEKSLMEARPQILNREVIRQIFYKIHDILRCHYMFRIELEQVVRVWDEEETIGNVFTASFSKSIVFEAYSQFIVNYSNAMDTAKKQMRAKPAFAEFLKQKLEASEDRLSLFGLMVKPVQRFPQFIMLLQDLLKFTPQNHHDRLSLQLALTELDTLTDRLNEAKRESESKLEVKRLSDNLSGIISFKIDSNSYLVRQDDIIEIKQKNGEVHERPRRLFLLSDQLICTEVSKRGDSLNSEKFAFQWSVPIKEVEYVESNKPSNYAMNVAPGKTLMSAISMERFIVPGESNPYKKDVLDMINDLKVFERMLQLSKELRLGHAGFDGESLQNHVRNLHLAIGKKCNMEHCLMTLSFPTKVLQVSTEKQFKGQVAKQISKVGRTKSLIDTDVRASSKVQFTFLFYTVAMKLDWLQELQNAKLASDLCLDSAWYTVENDQPTYKNPYFYHPLLLDIMKEDAKKLLKSKAKKREMIQCATCVTLPSPDDPDLRVHHLWVCNGDDVKGQVSIVSFHANQPSVVETFRLCDSLICCAESIPMIGDADSSDSVTEEMVWMGTQDRKIIVCKVIEHDRSIKRLTISTDSVVSSLKYSNFRMFVGMRNGTLLIYTFSDGVWNLKDPLRQSLGESKISCLLPIGQDMWVSSGQKIHVLTVRDSTVTKVSHELASDYGLIECMVKAGVGLMVAFSNRAIIRLYHLETLQHLQDINITSAITPLLEGKPLMSPFNEDKKLFSLNITCLLSGYGLLWVGTNYGFILTLPLPRLEGVPQVNRRPTVSYHAHSGPVKFLATVNCGSIGSSTSFVKHGTSVITKMLEVIETKATAGNDELVPVRQGDAAVADAGKCSLDANALLSESLKEGSEQDSNLSPLIKYQWISTPELQSYRGFDEEGDVTDLYGSLLKGIDADMDSEIIEPRQRSRGANLQQNISAVSSRMKNAVRRNTTHSQADRASADRASGKCHSVHAFAVTGGNCEKPDKDLHAAIPQSPSNNGPLNKSLEDDSGESQVNETPKVTEDQGSGHPNAENDAAGKRAVVSQSGFNVSALANSSVRRGATSKRLVVVSGGEGHINWKKKKPFDDSYEDICLLLWKC